MKTKTIARGIVAILVLAATALVVPAAPQTNDPDPSAAALAKRVADLEASLAALKAQLASRSETPAAQAPTPPPAAPSTVQPAMVEPFSTETGPEAHTLGPLQFRGYTDFGFGQPLLEKLPPGGLPGSTQSFTIGDFDLFVVAPIGQHLSVLSEVLVTSDFSNEFGAEIDRMMLTYKANDYFSATIGKFNTAIGFYTNEFHRARYFQTATSRPILFGDEDNGGILPVHSIGMTATGLIPSGSLGLHWVAEVANGRSFQGDNGVPVQNFVDENNGKAVNFALYIRPQWLHGFQAGGSFYRDTIHPPALEQLQQRIYSAYAALIRPRVELIAEGVLLQHLPASGQPAYNSTSTYGQASYKFGSVRPYLRYEYQNMAAGDPVFGSLGRENGPSVGVRFELNDFACLKVQYGRLGLRSGVSNNDVQAQFGLVF